MGEITDKTNQVVGFSTLISKCTHTHMHRHTSTHRTHKITHKEHRHTHTHAHTFIHTFTLNGSQVKHHNNTVTFSLGSTLGPIVGGYLSEPATEFAAFNTAFWREHPYLLPCLVSGMFCLKTRKMLIYRRKTRAHTYTLTHTHIHTHIQRWSASMVCWSGTSFCR